MLAGVAPLASAAPLVDGMRSRQTFALRFNLGVNLCHRGRHAQAVPLAAEARELVVSLRNESAIFSACSGWTRRSPPAWAGPRAVAPFTGRRRRFRAERCKLSLKFRSSR
jgi:hypothetical protein